MKVDYIPARSIDAVIPAGSRNPDARIALLITYLFQFAIRGLLDSLVREGKTRLERVFAQARRVWSRTLQTMTASMGVVDEVNLMASIGIVGKGMGDEG